VCVRVYVQPIPSPSAAAAAHREQPIGSPWEIAKTFGNVQ